MRAIFFILLGASSFVASPLVAQHEGAVSVVHRLHAELNVGAAHVTEELVMTSRAATLALRYELPEGAMLTHMEICNEMRCASGITLSSAQEVFDAARFAPREEGAPALAMAQQWGTSLRVDVAGRGVGRETLRMTWVSPTTTLAGQTRLAIPSRGEAVDVVLTSATLDGLALNGDRLERHVAADAALVLSGDARPGADELTRRVIGSGEGARTWLHFAPARVAIDARDVVILLDVSPGMRGREEEAHRALALVLRALPEGAHAHLIAFARHARVLASGTVTSLRHQALSLPRDLGPSTSAIASEEALLALEQAQAVHAPRVIWIGDGGVDWSWANTEAVTRLRARGMEAISVGPPAGNFVDRVGATTRIDTDEDMAERRIHGALSPRVQRRVRGYVLETRAGEDVFAVVRGVSGAGTESQAASEVIAPLAARALGEVDVDHPATLITIDPRDRLAARKVAEGRVAILHAGGGLTHGDMPERRVRICSCGPTYTTGALSRGVVQRLIQRTIVPRARACFAQERGGRSAWEGRATLVLGFEGNEVALAEVESESESLRACILQAIDHVEVPETDPTSRVVVRYPLVSRPLPPRVAITLDPAISGALDAILGEEPTTPPRVIEEP